VTAEEEGDI